ncbi:MAG: hypothetical protein BGP06_05845 [Rhizobiales bacterium 65-9]|nr:hypothetical protein [Hyphomicrobiales bacterium]OJY35389.1 MAG: hypothetical protein BGP06_05845 [Rhizobiales bacterium 65-9]
MCVFVRLFAAAVALFAFQATAGAQIVLAPSKPSRACALDDVIIATADFLLSEPQNPPRFWRDRIGADAAFLRIVYADMRDHEAKALIDKLASRRRPPERIVELKLAQADPAQRAALIAAIPVEAGRGSILRDIGDSVLRAMAVENGGEWLAAELIRWSKDDPGTFNSSLFAVRLPNALADLDDDARARFAARLEAGGLWAPAGLVLERNDDLAGWFAILDRRPAGPIDAKDREAMLRRPFYHPRWRALDIAKQPEELRQFDARRPAKMVTEALYSLAARMPEAQVLMTALNVTGESRVGSELAVSLLASIDTGALDPVNAPDAVHLAMIGELDRLLGREARERTLRSFKPYGAWSNGDNAAAALNKSVARLALAPVVTGKEQDAAKPASLPADFPWNDWTRIANTLRSGADVSVSDNRLIAAELLDATGRWNEALAVLRAEPDWQAARMRAYALLTSLDRRCGYELKPATPLNDPVYRFGAR